MSPVTKQDAEDGSIDTKAFAFHDPDTGFWTCVMATKFDAGEVSVLDDAGYGGENVMFTHGDGGVWNASHDPYNLGGHAVTTELIDLCNAIRSGVNSGGASGIPWDEVPHDETISALNVPELIGEEW